MPPAHPSSRPYGRNPWRRARLAASDRQWWTDAEPLSCVAQSGKRIIAVEPPGARRARVVRCIRPIARAGSTTSSRLRRTDAEPFRASRSRERESSQWNRPERAGRGWYVASVRLPGRGARLAASDRSQWTDAKTFRELRSRKSEGYARWCFTSPAHPSSRPCGRNPWRGARLTASDRQWWTDVELFPCVAQPGKRIIAVEPPGTRRARVVREVVRCIRPIARVASTASGRPQWTDAKTFREPRSRKSEGYAKWCFTSPAHPSSYPCGRNPWRRARLAASDRHQWTDAEPYRASRSRESGTAFYTSGTSVQSPVRAESAAAASTACSFRPSSMDGRGAFPCATQSRKE